MNLAFLKNLWIRTHFEFRTVQDRIGPNCSDYWDLRNPACRPEYAGILPIGPRHDYRMNRAVAGYGWCRRVGSIVVFAIGFRRCGMSLGHAAC